VIEAIDRLPSKHESLSLSSRMSKKEKENKIGAELGRATA
jgi:hypothetical protein